MTPRDRLSSLAAALRPFVADIATRCLGEPSSRTHGELRFGSKGALVVHVAGPRQGRWHDFSDGAGGDALDLLQRQLGGREQAIAEATRWVGEDRPSRPASRPVPEKEPAPRHGTLTPNWRRFWQACRPITTSDVAGRYLLARGCVLPPEDGDLRWHPDAEHPSGYTGAALVGLVTAVDDPSRAMNLHRTWVRADGGKAALARPRLLLAGHAKTGGVIRLWPDEAVSMGLGLAEGVETALSLARVFRPVWSTIDAGNLKAFPLLPGLDAITIAEDDEPAGREAAAALAKRYRDAGLGATIIGRGAWARI